jgi:hypothetical protein
MTLFGDVGAATRPQLDAGRATRRIHSTNLHMTNTTLHLTDLQKEVLEGHPERGLAEVSSAPAGGDP